MKLPRTLMTGLTVAMAPALAIACGACIEDRIAATYDHAVIADAIAKHRQVVFIAVDGPVNMKKVAARLEASAPRVRGLKAGTLRISLSPGAFSFALDARGDPAEALAAFRKALADPQAQLSLVRLVKDGALVDPS
jgi:hypothetical protein